MKHVILIWNTFSSPTTLVSFSMLGSLRLRVSYISNMDASLTPCMFIIRCSVFLSTSLCVFLLRQHSNFPLGITKVVIYLSIHLFLHLLYIFCLSVCSLFSPSQVPCTSWCLLLFFSSVLFSFRLNFLSAMYCSLSSLALNRFHTVVLIPLAKMSCYQIWWILCS